jgi:predicted nucleic acid-binding protein
MKVFFDASALAKRYIEEPGSEKVGDICSKATTLGVSSICLPEIISALCRLRRERSLSRGHYEEAKNALLKDFKDISVLNITPAVIGRGVDVLERNAVRTLDALHVACAMEWGAELFVSSDLRQLSAAKRTGLKTLKV